MIVPASMNASSFSGAQSAGFSSPDEFRMAAQLLSDISSQGPLFERALSGRSPRASDTRRARIDASSVELPRALLSQLSLGAESELAREVALASAEWALKEPGIFYGVAAEGPASDVRLDGALSIAKFRAAKSRSMAPAAENAQSKPVRVR